MNHYTVYSQITGEIRTVITTTAEIEDMYVPDGMHIASGNYPPHRYYWDGEFLETPEKPGDQFVFDFKEKCWVQDAGLASDLVRIERNKRLGATDWTQMPDVSVSDPAAWATYRQALRDITRQVGFPHSVQWPEIPKL